MKKYLPLIIIACLFLLNAKAQTTINFDNDGAWTQDPGVASLNAYGNHSYTESGVSVEGSNILRNSSQMQDGFEGALGEYSIRIRNAANSKIVITVSEGGVSDFSFDVRRWDGSPMPDYTVRYSVDGGNAWINLPNIDGSLLVSSNWFTYNGSINHANNNIQIEVANTGTTERIMVDNFSWSSHSSAPLPTLAVSANALTGLNYEVENGPGQAHTFTVSGLNLSHNIQIVPPANFEVSDNGTTYQSNTLTLTQSNGNVAATDIYVRLSEGLPIGEYTGNIEISSEDATGRTIALSGSVTAPPDYSIPYTENFASSLGDFTAFSQTGAQEWEWRSFNNDTYAYMNGYQGGANANIDWLISPTFDFRDLSELELSFTEAVNYLTSYNELKLMVSTNYTGSVADATWDELSVSGRSPGNWEFVVVDPISLDDYAGMPEVTFAFQYISTSAGASGWEISEFSITGQEFVPVLPDMHVSNFTAVAGSITQTSVELAWNENQGEVPAEGYLIKASTGEIAAPVDGDDPADDLDLTNGSGNVKVPAGTASFSFVNCAPATSYNFAIYPFVSSGQNIIYKTENAPTASATTLVQLAAPVISPDEGDYVEQLTVTISCETDGAVIYYALNDDELPSEQMIEYENEILLLESTTVKAISVLGNDTSEVVRAVFTISEPVVDLFPPVIAPQEGEYFDSLEVTITCVTQGAHIFYSINDDEAVEYSGKFTIYESSLISAYSVLGDETSETVTAQFFIQASPIIIAPVVISPEPGEYADSLIVSMASETEGANIYYTIDTEFNAENALSYTGSFTLYQSGTVTAVAVVDADSSDFAISEFIISVTPPEISAPVISPAAGEYESEIEIEITCETEGAVIYFTLDGQDPDENAQIYEGSFVLDEDATVKAFAGIEGYFSEITTSVYTITQPVVPVELTTLAQLRQSTDDGSMYHFTGTAVVTFAMNFRGQKYIQDETAAILIDDNDGNISTAFEIGDGITNLSGTLFSYNGLLQFTPTANAEKVSDHDLVIEPLEISVSEFVDNFGEYESKLIKLNSIEIDASGNFENGVNYTITDDDASSVLRTHFYNVDYIGSEIPSSKVNVTGIALWHFNEAKIAPRMLADFEELNSVPDYASQVEMFAYDNVLVVNNIHFENTNLRIYTPDGRLVTELRPDSELFSFNLKRPGLYIAVLSKNNVPFKSDKVIIK